MSICDGRSSSCLSVCLPSSFGRPGRITDCSFSHNPLQHERKVHILISLQVQKFWSISGERVPPLSRPASFDLRMLRMSQELHILAGVRWWGTICRQRLVWTPSSSLGRVDEKCLMFVQSNTNIDWKLVYIYWHASSKTFWESLRHGLNFESKLKRTIADCPEVLEVFSVETLKEKASMQMESSLLCLVVYWLFHRIWQDSRTHNGKSCRLTKGLATSIRSGFWRLKWALTMICQRSSQHIPRSDRHMFRCSAHILKTIEMAEISWQDSRMKCGYATLRNVCSFKCLTLLHLSGLLQTDLDNAETGSGVRGFVTQPPRMFGYVWVVAEPGQLPSVATACHCMPLLWSAMDLCSFKRFLGSFLLFSSARFWLGTAKVSPEAPAIACSRSISEFVTSILVTCHVVFAEFLRFTLTPSHAVATGLSTAAQEACCANLVKAKTSDIEWAI